MAESLLPMGLGGFTTVDGAAHLFLTGAIIRLQSASVRIDTHAPDGDEIQSHTAWDNNPHESSTRQLTPHQAWSPTLEKDLGRFGCVPIGGCQGTANHGTTTPDQLGSRLVGDGH